MKRLFTRILNLIPTPSVYANAEGKLSARSRINLLIKFSILTPLAIGVILYPGCVWLIAIISLPIVVYLAYARTGKRAERLAKGLCQNCAYDRAGISKTVVCPECGSPILAR